MILRGNLKHIGSSVHMMSSGNVIMDSLEVTGNRERRKTTTSSYLKGRLDGALGQEVALGISGSRLVAIKVEDGYYEDIGFLSVFGGNLYKFLLILLVIGPIIAISMQSMMVYLMTIVGSYVFFFVMQSKVANATKNA